MLERTGAAERIGQDNLFPTEPGWFVAMGHAIERALELTGEHACGSLCPLQRQIDRPSARAPAPTNA